MFTDPIHELKTAVRIFYLLEQKMMSVIQYK